MAESSPESQVTEETPTYSIGQWSGMAHYTCLDCGAQSFAVARMADHRREQHDGRMVLLPAEEETPAEEPVLFPTETPPVPPDIPQTEEPPHGTDAPDVP
jgi:hypothetical protein